VVLPATSRVKALPVRRLRASCGSSTSWPIWRPSSNCTVILYGTALEISAASCWVLPVTAVTARVLRGVLRIADRALLAQAADQYRERDEEGEDDR
jgi:hypothetical protein